VRAVWRVGQVRVWTSSVFNVAKKLSQAALSKHEATWPMAVNGLYKAELIGRHGPWRTAGQVELATAGWVRWWNHDRLHGAIGHIPPIEHEALYYSGHGQSKEVA
jgi:putative transposase